jgi:hypothetical protein
MEGRIMSDTETRARTRRTAAERKGDQRHRQMVDRAVGKPGLTAETMSMALLDALSLMLHDRDQAQHTEVVLHFAGFMLADGKNARAEMRRRLMRRLPKSYKES